MINSIARRPSLWGRVGVLFHGLAVGCVLHVVCLFLFVRFKRGAEPATWIESLYDNGVVHGVIFTLMLLAGTLLATFAPKRAIADERQRR